MLYLAQARLLLGDVAGAIAALDDAIAEEGQPDRVRTGARSDWALVIAAYRLTDRYDEALRYLEAANSASAPHLAEKLAAEAMIRAPTGDPELARTRAAQALELFGPLADGALEPPSGGRMPPFTFADLLERLRAIRG